MASWFVVNKEFDPLAPRDFRGLNALVTGAAGAIGSRIAEDLARAGAFVNRFDRVGPYWTEAPGERRFALDLSESADIGPRLQAALPDGPIDILVNCAGTRDVQSIETVTLEAWSRSMDINLTGLFFVSQWVVSRAMQTQNGLAIVNLASTAGLMGMPDRASYVAAKHGVVGLTKQMAVELAPYGIRVNAVAPGVIRTPMTEAYFADTETVEALERSHPLGLVGKSEDVSAAVLFLASDHARYITGAVLSVDGGFAAGKSIS